AEADLLVQVDRRAVARVGEIKDFASALGNPFQTPTRQFQSDSLAPELFGDDHARQVPTFRNVFEAALGGRACIVDASVSGDGLLDARHENEMSRGRRLKKSKRTLARLGVREPL